MNKKLIILISIAILLVAAGGGYLIVSFKNISDISSVPVGENATANKEIVSADLDYSDASGFYFKYPKSLRVDDITPSDDSYYSKVSLTKAGGKLTVTLKDETAKDVDEFISSDDYYKKATLSGATTLAGISAKQYVIEGKLMTVALKDGILYQVEGNKDGGFWEDSQGIVVSTFGFGQKSSGDGTTSDTNTTYEPEEIVE